MSPFDYAVIFILTTLFVGISLTPFVDHLPKIPPMIAVNQAEHAQTDEHEKPV